MFSIKVSVMASTSRRSKRAVLDCDITDSQENAKKQKVDSAAEINELFLSFFVQNFKTEITTIESSIKSKHLRISELEEIIKEKDFEIKNLKDQNEFHKASDRKKMESLESELSEKKDLINTLKARLKDKNDKSIQEAIEKNGKYKRHLEDLEETNKDLSDKLSLRESEVQHLKTSLTAKLAEQEEIQVPVLYPEYSHTVM